jgi:hypothetical protein
MSFDDRRALETMLARLAALAGLNVILDDRDLYARDPGRSTVTGPAQDKTRVLWSPAVPTRCMMA